MYCHGCGIALTLQTRYCNRCGVQLVASDQTGDLKRKEKRLDEYLDGLFWITVFGVGLVLGGMVLMKKVGLSDLFILAYLILSSTAFFINFVINLTSAVRLGKATRAPDSIVERSINQIPTATKTADLAPVPSVTEHTTRSFAQAPVKREGQ